MASAFLYSEILRTCQNLYKATDYHEFPEIVLISYPFTRGQKEKIQQDLILCFQRIEQCGAEVICVASHSFHGLLPKQLPKGFVHLVDEGLLEAARQKITKALILSAPLTIHMKLYERSNIECIYPDDADQQIINEIIREIAGGRIEENQSERISCMIQNATIKYSCNGIIIACTELPLAYAKKAFVQTIPIINTTHVLAKQILLLAQ